MEIYSGVDRAVRQRQLRGQYRQGARTARGAGIAARTRGCPNAGTRSAACAAASVPMLRWPHDRHRGVRAGMRTKARAGTGRRHHQDRYIMSKGPTLDQIAAHLDRWSFAGIAPARAADAERRLLHRLDPPVSAVDHCRRLPRGHYYRCTRFSGLVCDVRSPRLTCRARHQSP